jgi:hypothetical protein
MGASCVLQLMDLVKNKWCGSLDVLEDMAVWGLRESCIHRIREEFEMCILTDFESLVICWEFFSEIRDGLSRECDLSWLLI